MVMRDVEFAVLRLVSEKVPVFLSFLGDPILRLLILSVTLLQIFREFMEDPVGRSRFRAWLKGQK